MLAAECRRRCLLSERRLSSLMFESRSKEQFTGTIQPLHEGGQMAKFPFESREICVSI